MEGAANVGEIELSDDIFAAEINVAAMHLVDPLHILANKRQGTQSALKPAPRCRGGGRKIVPPEGHR